ncbi:MAG: C1 family peptidase, partial [Bacteroidota bacterium]
PTYTGQKYDEIPLKFSLKKYCPIPGNQGNISSCVGWAVGYGAYTIMRANQLGETDLSKITQMANSAAFIYNQIKTTNSDCTAGAYIEDALTLLKDQGDCLEVSFNFETANCNGLPGEIQLQEAVQYRIKDFAAVFELDEVPKRKISTACKVLATQTPIIVAMEVTPDFWEIKPGTAVWKPQYQESENDFHAMVLVGYDNVSKKFQLMNSFGPSWGRNGFIEISYTDFAKLCRSAYVLMPFEHEKLQQLQEATSSTQSIAGEFVFRRPVGYLTTAEGSELPFFEEVQTELKNDKGLYTTQQDHFSVGDVFQLVARSIPRGQYAYVFSQNPEGAVNLHFPKTTSNGMTAGFVLDQTAEIVIPNEETVLQLSVKGIDHLCVVYSTLPIEDIQARLMRLEHGSASLSEKLYDVFGDLLIQDENIRYSKNNMAFSAVGNTQTRAVAVPLILKVEAL